ncbi:OLC1v1019301C1 [Oldenlandia corymbosa var. corymbosa]|uniref:OLC1v1019301C1 n=1 Tax=Oldenlandia corymbosa var. corymbosa TaxID=529605 RepID=A0AAV1EDK1_OLDCO|nr:OLC1v1019301C1 [Oldenlandia corymbosa var. corymbosa]
MDRISSLPDEILCHMLSFLPTKLGATTGVLSKRWRNVWGSVPVLCFEGLKEADFADLTAVDSDFGFAESEAASFNGFMDRLLRFRGDSRTQKFRLESEYLEPELLYKWMRSLRNVEELDLDIRSFGELNWRDIGFAAASIKTIKLSGDFNLNIPSDLSFPCLKILHLLYVIYEDDSAIEKLLYNCPVLEELKISRQLWDNVKNFVIYAPLVKSSSYAPSDHVICFCKQNEGSGARDNGRNTYYGKIVCGLFSSISDVKALKIGSFTLESLSDALDIRLPIYHKLVHLEVNFNGMAGAMLLPSLLGVTPVLETLILPLGITSSSKKGFVYDGGFSFSDQVYEWKPQSNVPHCLLHSLKVVEIRRIRSKVVEELKLLKYILENAMVLEEMTILCEEGAPLGQPPMGIDNVRGRGRSSSGGRPVAANQFAETFAAIRDEVMNYGRGSAGCQVQILNQCSPGEPYTWYRDAPIPVIDVSHLIV